MTVTVDAPSLSEHVWGLLSPLEVVNVFDGPPEFPEYQLGDASTHRFWDLDDAGQVIQAHAYAAYYPSPGWSHAARLDAAPDSLDWTFQVTCVGGDTTTALWCVKQIREALSGARIDSAHGSLVIREVGDPGPVRTDRDITPHRRYVPLDFAVSA